MAPEARAPPGHLPVPVPPVGRCHPWARQAPVVPEARAPPGHPPAPAPPGGQYSPLVQPAPGGPEDWAPPVPGDLWTQARFSALPVLGRIWERQSRPVSLAAGHWCRGLPGACSFPPGRRLPGWPGQQDGSPDRAGNRKKSVDSGRTTWFSLLQKPVKISPCIIQERGRFLLLPLGCRHPPLAGGQRQKGAEWQRPPPPGTAGKGRLPPPQYMRLRPVGFGEGNHLFCPGPVAICRRVKYNQRGETSRQERGILGNGQKGICAAKAPGMAG